MEEIEVFTPTPNELYLEMSQERLVEAYGLLQTNFDLAIEDQQVNPSNLETIYLGLKLSEVTSTNSSSNILACLGCGVVLFACLFIFLIGLSTMLGWN